MAKSPLVNKQELRGLVPASPSTVDRLERRGEFPRRMTLTPGSRAVFWRRHEVEAWLRERGVELSADDSGRPSEAAAAGRLPAA